MSGHRALVWTLLLVGSLLVLSGCAPRALTPLVLEGPELHPSLVTRRLEGAATYLLAPVVRANPYLSTDREFVNLLTRVASQDRLPGGKGVRAALYALYLGEREVGLYGLETASRADADRVEDVLRKIWSHNASLELAQVHRRGNVLVVVWSAPDSPSCWEAMNARVAEILAAL